MAAKFRNKFVFRHFCYYFVYFSILTPYYVASILWFYSPDREKYFEFMKASIIVNLSLSFIMFFVRASETSFFKFFICKKRLQSPTISVETRTGEKDGGSFSDGFLDPDEPLTAIINKTLNLEFICCVLYGLSQIFLRNDKSDEKLSMKNSLTVSNPKSLSSINPKRYKFHNFIFRKDFKTIKPNNIYYKKIYDDFNFDVISMEIKNSKQINDNNLGASMLTDNFSQTLDYDESPNNKQDAIILEYCPRMFKELRSIDDISAKELEK